MDLDFPTDRVALRAKGTEAKTHRIQVNVKENSLSHEQKLFWSERIFASTMICQLCNQMKLWEGGRGHYVWQTGRQVLQLVA